MYSTVTRPAVRSRLSRRHARAAGARPGDRPAQRPPQRFGAEPLERRVLLAVVSGLKFNDLDGDGVGEVGEPGLQGWTIYHDANNNSALDAGEPRVVTGVGGTYTLTFPAGNPLNPLIATSEVIREVPQAGWRPTTPPNGATTLVVRNTDVRTVNFGNTQLGLIVGLKYNDQNGNGLREPSEPGLPNWRIYADLNRDGTFDSGEPSDLTDTNGFYQIPVPRSPTPYQVREVLQANWRQTFPGPQHAPGFQNVLVAAPGQAYGPYFFGNTQRVLLTGRKINDLDGDGAADAGESGLGGWRIYIDSDNDGNFDAGEPSDLTDPDGRYSFSPAGGGPFVLREVRQTGWRQTAPQSASLGDAHRIVFAVPFEGDVASGYNFLNTRRPHISGVKFNDVDADGVRDTGEPGLEGWTIYLDANDNNQLDAGETSDVTDADGIYTLIAPAPPTDAAAPYTIREVGQPFWRQTAPDLPEGERRIFLLPAQFAINQNFGNTQRVLISGVKYEDRNGNGARDDGEPGISGFRIYADTNDNGTFDTGEESVVTATDGSYSIDLAVSPLILPGRPNVILREVLPDTWTPISPAGGEHRMTLLRGAVATGRDFGNARWSSVAGRKYHDLDADGIDDATEPGLENWRIYVDSNNNGVYDTDVETVAATSGLPDTTSNTAVTRSRINVSGLPPVLTDVNVRVDIAHPNVGDLSVFLISPRGRRVELFSNVGGTSDNIDRVLFDDESANTFTNTSPPYANETIRPEGSLAVFDTFNPNGQWTLEVVDAGSASTGSLDAWELVLSTAEPSALTAPTSGVYSIGLLPPGTHVVREVRQAGWFPTGPASATRTVTTISGTTRTNVDFGNARPGSVSGRKWHDRDGDGTIDSGEPGLGGWTIYRDLDNDGVMDTANTRFDSPPVAAPIRDAVFIPGPGPVPGIFPGFSRYVMTVPAIQGQIIDLNVAINITHPRIADLTLTLTSPSGEVVNLTGDLTAAGANMNTTFDDSAPTSISSGTPPYTGVFRPAQPLSTFQDDDPEGAWLLTIVDSTPGPAGAATLNAWGLDLTYGDPRRLTAVDGAYTFAGLRPGVVHVVREVPQAGWQQTFPIDADNAHSVRLNSNENRTGVNFGNREGAAPAVTDLYARSSGWAAPDGNPATLTFKEFLGANGLGHEEYGFRVANGATLPWINVDQLVLRYDQPLAAAPPASSFLIDGVRGDYTPTVTLHDSRTVVLTLDRVLGVLTTGGVDGDRIRFAAGPTAPGGAAFSRGFNVLQGDVNRNGSVLANDYSEVKSRFFQNTNQAVYSAFHDVDGSGSVLANDYSAVKARFFDNLPPLPAAAVAPASSAPASALFGSRRIRPTDRVADLLA